MTFELDPIRRRRRRSATLMWAMLALIFLTGCIVFREGGPLEPDRLNEDDDPILSAMDRAQLEAQVLARFEPLDAAAQPPSPTNRVADDLAAARLGKRLFFDPAMSADQTVSCASCHPTGVNFSDPAPVSTGVFGRVGTRHAPSVMNLGFQDFLLWDGRADSAWSQAIKAIEAPAEMDLTRVELARFIQRRYAAPYEAIFGPLPSLEGLPERARPGLVAWESMTAQQRRDVDQIAANVGKALEAYQRKLTCDQTPLDLFLRGERTVLSTAAMRGAVAFDDSGCTSCHSGALLSDGLFHHIGIGSADEIDALGRQAGIAALQRDVFNGRGDYSDDRDAGDRKLRAMAREVDTLGAFKTPSLRGVSQRRVFMHNGSLISLREVVGFYAASHELPTQEGAVGVHAQPFLQLQVRNRADILTFLEEALTCAPVPATWR